MKNSRFSLIICRINITFSISALSDLVTAPNSFDEDLPDISTSAGSQSEVVTNGDTKAPDGRTLDNEVAKSYSVPINVTIEKDGADSALSFDIILNNGDIQISKIYHYVEKEQVNTKTTEQTYSQRTMYTGPPYGNLDEDLQRLVEDYLRERGISTTLAQWVPEYIDFKEQKEYMQWLCGSKITSCMV